MYDDPHSLYCSKLKAALHAKGVPFTVLPLPCGGTTGAEYRAVVPLGKIPALLVTEPGESKPALLMETEVMIEWLEDRFPAPTFPALLPSDPLTKAQARILSRFHDLYFEPSLRKLYPQARCHPTLLPSGPCCDRMADLVRGIHHVHGKQVAPAKRDPAVVEAVVKELQGRLVELEQLVGRADELVAQQGGQAAGAPPALPFGHLSLPDCGFAFAWFYVDLILRAITPSGQSLDYPPRIQAWKEALEATQPVRAVLEVLRPSAEEWLQSKLAPPVAT